MDYFLTYTHIHLPIKQHSKLDYSLNFGSWSFHPSIFPLNVLIVVANVQAYENAREFSKKIVTFTAAKLSQIDASQTFATNILSWTTIKTRATTERICRTNQKS